MPASRQHRNRQASSLAALALAAGACCAGENPYGAGLVVLDTNGSGALTMSGQAHVQLPANAVYVNSNHQTALKTSGQCVIETPHLYTCAPQSSNVASHCTGQVTFSACAYADPLCNLSFPTTSGMTNHGNKSINSSQVVTLQPGRYGDISISGQAKVMFQPGVYVIQGDMSVSGQVEIGGAGVSLVFSSKSLSISGGASIEFTPPSSGNLAGVVFAQPSSNSTPMSLSGGSEMNIGGTIYVPGAEIKLSGQGTVSGEGPQVGDLVVCKTATLSGQGLIKIGQPNMAPIELPKMPLYD
jgi:hypothetical protein